MKKTITTLCLGGCALVFAFSACAQEISDEISFDFGGDIRARYEFNDNFPDKGKSTAGSGYSDHLRFRTRIWARMEAGENLSIYLRLGNEFRNFRNTSNNSKQKFPDELFVDNLFVEWEDDAFGLKVGRQEIRKGAGRIITNGTPGDGMRSCFFDAVALTWKLN